MGFIHLSGVVGIAATIPALAAFIFRKALPLPASIVLWHAAGAGIAVALSATDALAKHSTWIVGKDPNTGKINLLGFTALWPYHVGLRTKLFLQRKYSTEPAWNQVTNKYFLGAWPSEEALVPSIHPAILDVTCELPLQLTPPAYKALLTWDTHGPSPEQIDEGVEFALQQTALGRPVLVHCAHGHGRSATLLCAILIAEGSAQTIEQALAILKAQRPRVRLNSRQRAALKEWLVAAKRQ